MLTHINIFNKYYEIWSMWVFVYLSLVICLFALLYLRYFICPRLKICRFSCRVIYSLMLIFSRSQLKFETVLMLHHAHNQWSQLSQSIVTRNNLLFIVTYALYLTIKPANIYLFKSTIETLEVRVKYVLS